MSCVSRLNNLYWLHLDQHNINFMYSLHSKERSGYYLKVRNIWVWLISCLPDSNKNSAREFIRVSGNWHANELTCPTSPRDIGLYRSCWIHFYYALLYVLFAITPLFIYVLMFSIYDDTDN